MAEEKSSFGLVERAWEIAKIYNGSDRVKHFDGIVEGNSLKTLKEFVRDLETRGIDFNEKSDDRLDKYNVVKIVPIRHLDEVSNAQEMYLITDEHGHDIGTYEITENGPEFKLSPKIKDYNEKILAEFPKQEREILDELYQTNTLEDLIGKLDEDQSIALASKEQAKYEINPKYKEIYGTPVDGGKEYQDQDEKNALYRIPADMRGQAIEFARQNGLEVKEILIVDNPKQLSKSIDNRNNQIAENGGPVILIKTKSRKSNGFR